MAFWGVAVKPGEPYIHRYHPSHGRLRITQASLGNCDATTRSVVQCIMGDHRPVILCNLNPKLAEMCSIEVELAEENQDVVFSVLGQSAVHLSGYYLGSGRDNGRRDDESESYGEDVGVSDTEEEYDPDNDKYESDFIDDGDVLSPRKRKVFDKPTTKTASHRRLKKQQVSDTQGKKLSPRKPATKRGSIFDSLSEDEDEDEEGKKLSPRKPATKQGSIFESLSEDEDENILPISVALKKLKNNKKPKKSETNMRTLDNGLIIEDLLMGNPDGKIASSGCKVRINYVGKLQNGKIVHSNVNKKSFKFKLGAGKVIEGWDVGVSGMRVGGKRRLTIPPAMGYDDRAMDEIPENSWLIYEVELVKVK